MQKMMDMQNPDANVPCKRSPCDIAGMPARTVGDVDRAGKSAIQLRSMGEASMTDDLKSTAVSRRSTLKALGLGAMSLIGSAPLLGPRAYAETADIQSLEKGYITAACTGEMPLTGERDGKPIGTDLELLGMIADRLGLKMKVVFMGFRGSSRRCRPAARTGSAAISPGPLCAPRSSSSPIRSSTPAPM